MSGNVRREGAAAGATRRDCLAFGAALSLTACVLPAAPRAAPLPSGGPEDGGLVPIPPAEMGLRTVQAEMFHAVSDEGLSLEGAAFDRAGGLLFVDAGEGRILRLSPDRRLSVIVPANDLGASGIAVHRDGRIFVAAVGDLVHGSVRAVRPDGSFDRTVVGPDEGFLPNDLVFDRLGGFYFTDCRGSATDLSGGVYYVGADGRAPSPILRGLGAANGVALGPEGRELWVTEYGRNALHRIELAGARAIAPFGSTVAYNFVGPVADSMRVDRGGNVYVAMTGQGKVLAFNRRGLPIGQVLIPGRDQGLYLKSTSLAIKPGTREMFVVSSGGREAGGAAVFRAEAFDEALPLYSHA